MKEIFTRNSAGVDDVVEIVSSEFDISEDSSSSFHLTKILILRNFILSSKSIVSEIVSLKF